MNLSKTTIEPDFYDKIVGGVGLVGLLILIGLPVIHYSTLPDTIPVHFGLSGKPDGFGSKALIWTLPIIGALIFIWMTRLARQPKPNIPAKVTEENAAHVQRIAAKTIRLLATGIVLIFSLITHLTIQTALGKSHGLEPWFIPAFIILIFGPLAYYFTQLPKRNKSKQA